MFQLVEESHISAVRFNSARHKANGKIPLGAAVLKLNNEDVISVLVLVENNVAYSDRTMELKKLYSHNNGNYN